MLRFLPQFGTDPFEVMTGPQLLKIAPRLAAYEGVVTGVIRRMVSTPTEEAGISSSDVREQVQPESREIPSDALDHDPNRVRMPAGAKVVSLASMQLTNGDLIERKVVGRDGS